MEAKVVFHLDWDDEKALMMALSNMGNPSRTLCGESVLVRVVANGYAVMLFRRERASAYESRIKELLDSGARFLMCGNALVHHGIKQEELLECCKVVPAGIVEIIRLQNEGFAYVKP